jgi:hypothetical protein
MSMCIQLMQVNRLTYRFNMYLTDSRVIYKLGFQFNIQKNQNYGSVKDKR